MDQNHKLIIYQLLPRLFGNANATNKYYGSIEENGVGKLNDITDKALYEIKAMGFTHIWYTGVTEHATMTDYTRYGIPNDDPDVVKGRAGSPYAIRDYYDIAPDLALDVPNRMAEFEALVKRTHNSGLKVIIDLVPNHVARTYASDAKPANVRDFGADDDTGKAFSPQNDFYYIPGQAFVSPQGYNPGGDDFHSPLKDGKFEEHPAKATGNDVFSAAPAIDTWFETVKLNYGVDYQNGHQCHFDPIPPMWQKIEAILEYWSAKGVDGFRCDMVEMVPVEFWHWVIAKVKTSFPNLIFMGEAYNTSQYSNYLFNGGFDYLYDKVGLYDSLKRLIRNEGNASIWDINKVCFHESHDFPERMLRFLENHDEERIASYQFAGDAWLALPAMIVTATLSTGPVMVYFGQEVGEPGAGNSGFTDDNGRTTIFDYWGVPEHQKWLNGGKFDGGLLSQQQTQLRNFYGRLLNVSVKSEAIVYGRFYELVLNNLHGNSGFDERIYAYLRYTDKQRVLVLVNFNRQERSLMVNLPHDLLTQLNLSGQTSFKDLLSGTTYRTDDIGNGIALKMPPSSGVMLGF